MATAGATSEWRWTYQFHYKPTSAAPTHCKWYSSPLIKKTPCVWIKETLCNHTSVTFCASANFDRKDCVLCYYYIIQLLIWLEYCFQIISTPNSVVNGWETKSKLGDLKGALDEGACLNCHCITSKRGGWDNSIRFATWFHPGCHLTYTSSTPGQSGWPKLPLD